MGGFDAKWARSREWRQRWIRPISLAMTALGVGLGLYYIAFLGAGGGVDAHAYFVADPFSPYAHGSEMAQPDAYLYSPAFAQLLEPLRLLGWDAFVAGIRLIELGALIYVAGPLTPLALFWSPVASEINAGNIHILLAAVCVYGLRRPWAWSFVILTKVTPAVGLLWFAARGEWTNIRLALAVTLGVALASAALSPQAWIDWFSSLSFNVSHPVHYGPFTPTTIALDMRAPIAALLALVAGRRGWSWMMPGVVTLSLPSVWFPSLSVLAAAPRRLYADLLKAREYGNEGLRPAPHAGRSVPGPAAEAPASAVPTPSYVRDEPLAPPRVGSDGV